jgi:hypothetical protein
MSRRLLVLNALLVALAAGSAAYIVWELARPPGAATPLRARGGPAAPVVPPAPPAAQPPPGGYAVIASRNLFSPSRSDAPVTGGPAGTPAIPPVKLTLYGVVLKDGVPVAYLEDPLTKRVTGYRVGDAIGGGTVTTIAADRVVVARPDGPVDVRLHDPTKVRPVVGSPTAPGLPGTTGAPAPPGAGPAPLPGAPLPPGQAIQPPQPSPVFPPGRRPLPPNLLRRGPGVPSDGSSR